MAVEARKRRVQQDVENNVHMQRGQVDVQSVFTCKGIIFGVMYTLQKRSSEVNDV